ncbi:mechanosensitive ion channel family protein [Uliginosibacterium paludis]|uniref:Small-conductance mechanosensitive channel n=1 Tax=Uliginosibacterium paludis TaxID=1615952 RepID=A0ABV2CQN4_9RHOO
MRLPFFFRLLLLSIVLLTGMPAVRAEDASAPAATATAQDLVFMNRSVIRFRTPLLGATPEQRAERGRQNVGEILARREADQVELKADPAGRIVMIGGRMAFFIANEDVDRLSGESLDALSQTVVERLERAIREMHEARDGQALIQDALLALGETVLLVLAVLGVIRLRQMLARRLLRTVAEQAGRLRLAGMALVRRDRLQHAMRWLLGGASWALCAVFAYTWLSAVLARFPYTRVWGEQLNDFLLGVLLRMVTGMLGAIPNLLIVALMFFVARAATGMLSPLFERVERGQATAGWLDRDTAGPTRKLVTLLIWIFAVVMAYPYLPGAQTEAFKGMSVLLGLMISLGASSVVGQAASGLILMYSRTIRRGEYVRIGEHEGTVMELGLFTTRLRTGRGAEITLPNSLIVGTATQNQSRGVEGAGFLIDTTVTIGYDTPWRQVEAMLVEAAGRTAGVRMSPPPRVYQLALSDFYPEYCLVCHAVPATPQSRADVMSQLHAHIQDVFNQYGVQIMSPHYMADPAEPKRVSPEAARPAPVRPDAA